MNDMEIVNEITSRLLKIVEITFNYGKENDDFEIIRDNLRPKEAWNFAFVSNLSSKFAPNLAPFGKGAFGLICQIYRIDNLSGMDCIVVSKGFLENFS